MRYRGMLLRSYDQLQVARIQSGHWLIPVGEAQAGWPYLALFAMAGRASVLCDESSLLVSPRDLCILRNSSSLRLSAEPDADLALILLPLGAVGPYTHVLDLCDGQSWCTDNGTASLVGHLLDGLLAQIAGYTPDNPGRLAQHIVGLLALMCSEDRAVDGTPEHRQLLGRAKDFIEHNLSDASLTPDTVADALHVSTRTLHRLFESDGHTISGWIRLRRLEHCRADLADRVSDGSSVSSIGARWGLWDAAHFSRLFKSSYGMPPRAYRDAQRSARLTARPAIVLEPFMELV
jgi:AraC-like DNA-binding protein